MRLDTILRKTQAELKAALIPELKSLGYSVRVSKGFIYARGTLPVLLVAHLDTVHPKPVQRICTSNDGNILMSPEGIGGDDRAGVYMILQLLQKHHCHVLFCEDEESGGQGALAFVNSGIKPSVNYILELDRRGEKDAVFYSCNNPEFTDFVCSFGFEEEFGSFSDISIIAPALGIAAVNLSCGYEHAHTRHEIINLAHLRKNIQRVSNMLATPSEPFNYVEGLSFDSNFPDLISLSPAPNQSYALSPSGCMIEGGDRIYVDHRGAPYEYYEELGVAVALPGYSVWTPSGLPVRYNARLAQTTPVVPYEYVISEY